ncbi:MAG: aconitase family protein, partial [Solirubrobacteraceae bacterium]
MDQALLQDATGTMALMQFEELGEPRVKVERAVQYIDHNVVQLDFKNPDDHLMLQALAREYGLHFSRPGNGISHYIHMERFGKPGQTMLGADSHTVQGGCLGMIAIGAGGLDVAVVLGGHPYEIACPEVVEVRLEGQLQRPWVQAKDIILELLRRLRVCRKITRQIARPIPHVDSGSVTVWPDDVVPLGMKLTASDVDGLELGVRHLDLVRV